MLIKRENSGTGSFKCGGDFQQKYYLVFPNKSPPRIDDYKVYAAVSYCCNSNINVPERVTSLRLFK